MLLIGLGNLLMSDEGIGVRLVAELEARKTVPPGVELLDMGTAGISILHQLAGHTKAVFVDCAFMGEEPGTLRRFTPEEVVTHKVQTRLSLHEGDLLNTLKLAKELGDCPEEIIIFGIEPQSVEPGLELTDALENRVEYYLQQLVEEVSLTPCMNSRSANES